MPGCSGGPVVTTLVWFVFIFHARLRVHRAPGIPHALIGRKIFAGLGRNGAAGMLSAVIASEAKQSSFLTAKKKAGSLRCKCSSQ
jgi:hypothetical protein